MRASLLTVSSLSQLKSNSLHSPARDAPRKKPRRPQLRQLWKLFIIFSSRRNFVLVLLIPDKRVPSVSNDLIYHDHVGQFIFISIIN